MNRTELLKIAKPILFNTDMVKAILEGRKTVTRRVVKLKDNRGIWEPINNCRNHEYGASVPCYLHREISVDDYSPNTVYPKIDVGDYLYVRETWNGDWCDHYIYKADGGSAKEAGYSSEPKWKPSLHMPKEAARIFLKVTDVRVERVQDINGQGRHDDVLKEGYPFSYKAGTPINDFISLWNSTIKKVDLDKYGWNANPWVWVYEFERINNNENNNN